MLGRLVRPAGLRRGHATAPRTWARLHVLEAELLFRDLVSGEERRLASMR